MGVDGLTLICHVLGWMRDLHHRGGQQQMFHTWPGMGYTTYNDRKSLDTHQRNQPCFNRGTDRDGAVESSPRKEADYDSVLVLSPVLGPHSSATVRKLMSHLNNNQPVLPHPGLEKKTENLAGDSSEY
ncbi:unnamed protein product [Natator depressus]